jgi:membrane protein implicated in regulation of membrane protease activity
MGRDVDITIWLVVAVALLVAEATTTAFVAAYFAIGALLAALAAALGAPLWAQGAEFVIVSVGLMVLTRQLVLRGLGKQSGQRMNVYALEGQQGIVTIPIDNDAATGQIRIGSEYWTARSVDELPSPIPVGAKVDVVDVRGVTARVRPRVSIEAVTPEP